jgi:hypothetical protein
LANAVILKKFKYTLLMRFVTALLVLLFSACPQPMLPDCNSGGGADFAVAAPAAPELVPSGVDYQFKKFAPTSFCGIKESDLSATVEIFSPSGVRIVLPLQNQTLRLTAQKQIELSVTLKPQEAGDYVVRILFEPGLGAVNHNFSAFRESAAPVAESVNYTDCTALFRTPNGTVVCEQNTNGMKTTSLRRGAGAAVVLPGGDIAVVGNTLWIQNKDSLDRFVDNGTNFVRTHSLPKTGLTIPLGSEHREQFTMRYDGTGFQKYAALDDGGIKITRGLEWMSHTGNVIGADEEQLFNLSTQTMCLVQNALPECRPLDFTFSSKQITGIGSLLGMSAKSVVVSASNGTGLDGFRIEPRPLRFPVISTVEKPVSNIPGRAFPAQHSAIDMGESTYDTFILGDRPLLTKANNRIFEWRNGNNGIEVISYPGAKLISVNDSNVAIAGSDNRTVLFFSRK